jgi:hypothetical protein
VLSRGNEWIFAQNLGHVVKFVGLKEDVGPVLSPDQLVQRLSTFLATAVRIIRQMPDAMLETEVPNRPRSYRVLGHHIFRIPESMLETAAGAYMDNLTSNLPPPDDMRSTQAITVYGQDVLDRLTAWWDGQADSTASATVQTYYGPQSLHELMERTTWHSGQHVRQWFMLLEMAGVAPEVRLTEADFAGLPMPSSVWDG